MAPSGEIVGSAVNADTFCVYVITVPEGNIVKLAFQHFDVRQLGTKIRTDIFLSGNG